ncbi:MAG: DUF3459 domain-containing protein [Chitinophagaceae bacterium]|nr:DUF3459 domain-containing protein [Chitinophagaceae bacterium]
MSGHFEPAAWSYDTNIYEVNLRQYTREGTFNAFKEELPRLRDMGVEVLWFMPITPISKEKRLGTLGSYYACSDYLSTNPEYGTLEDFKKLTAAAHALGMKVIIDWVANHTGWDHTWTRQYPAFYRRNLEGNFYDAHGWEDVIDLNYDNRELWNTMLGAMQFWIDECNIDGFRCDMAMLIPLEFWRFARTELDKKKKLFWLAECEEIHYHEVFDATYTWKFLHAMEAYWKKEIDMVALIEVLNYYESMFPVTALRAYFTTNHDENSHSGSEYERMGNSVQACAVLCCTLAGVPLIYSGQELPLVKRIKFFEKDYIEWTGKYALHEFYKTLLQLRKSNPALRAGDLETAPVRVLTNAGKYVLAYCRNKGERSVLVLINLSGDDKSLVKLNYEKAWGKYRNVFTSNEAEINAETYFYLRAWDFQIYEK